jgi:hypothetical protein
MARKIFYSFNFKQDSHRVAKVKNMEVLEAQTLLSANKWEDVKAGGAPAIKKWIDEQMTGKSCVVVLIGANTADRKWVDYEIKKAWDEKKGLLGVRINNLTDLQLKTTAKGPSPFAGWTIGADRKLSSVVKIYDPAGADSAAVLANIKKSLPAWVEAAIKIREDFKS